MKIMFVVPAYPNRVSEYLVLPSIEVCINSSILKQNNHQVKLLDMKIENLVFDDIKDELKDFNPDYVVIDDEPKTHCSSKILINDIRTLLGDSVKIGIRGEIPSFISESVMERNPNLDFILRFDDDYALLKVVDSNFELDKLKEIPNIAYRTKDNFVVNKRVYCTYKLDTLPRPDRKLYNIQKYLKRDSETIVRSNRGCPGNCLFCIKTRYEHFRLFSVERFCDEIEELLSYGFTSFFFSDDTFAFSDERLDEFYKEVKKRNLKFKWTSNIRIADINDFKISRMKEIGAYRVFIGVETVSAQTQQVINKNLNIDLIKEKIEILKKYDMEFHASFILGNPGDTEADIEETIKFVKQVKPTLVTFNLIKVYPGLDLYANPEKYGIVMPDKYWYEKDDWSKQVVTWTKDLPRESLERLSKKCLFEFISGAK